MLLAGGSAEAQLYRWTDGEGVDHYTADLQSIPAQFRDRAQEIGAPTPGPVVPVEPATPGGTVIPYTSGSPLVVDGAVNGVAVKLLVDTGAERTLITPAAMTRAGVDFANGTPVKIRGVTGDGSAMLVTTSLDVAGSHVGDVPVVVHTLGNQGVDGLLGRDVLDGFTVTVDAASRRAVLTPR